MFRLRDWQTAKCYAVLRFCTFGIIGTRSARVSLLFRLNDPLPVHRMQFCVDVVVAVSIEARAIARRAITLRLSFSLTFYYVKCKRYIYWVRTCLQSCVHTQRALHLHISIVACQSEYITFDVAYLTIILLFFLPFIFLIISFCLCVIDFIAKRNGLPF